MPSPLMIIVMIISKMLYQLIYMQMLKLMVSSDKMNFRKAFNDLNI
jgi:hypothetical protein